MRSVRASILKSIAKFWVKRWPNQELVVQFTVQIMFELTTSPEATSSVVKSSTRFPVLRNKYVSKSEFFCCVFPLGGFILFHFNGLKISEFVLT